MAQQNDSNPATPGVSEPRAAPPAEDAYTLDDQLQCVLDTNVLLEIYSIHDVTTLYNREHEKHGNAAEDVATVVYRRQRAAHALALAIALHERAFATFQLVHESLRILKARVPPDSDALELVYVQLFLYYIKDYCLADWKTHSNSSIDLSASGSECDNILLNIASINGLPLITNEGNKVGGVDESHGLRKRATDAGVKVYSPLEYLGELGITFPAASMRFAERFHANMESYLATCEHSDTAAIRRHLSFIGNVYDWCFDAT